MAQVHPKAPNLAEGARGGTLKGQKEVEVAGHKGTQVRIEQPQAPDAGPHLCRERQDLHSLCLQRPVTKFPGVFQEWQSSTRRSPLEKQGAAGGTDL